jgi:2-dehydro-3-deoxygalactonokinase
MTGEMYQVTGSYSILKDSVTMNDDRDPSPIDVQAFKAGVKNSLESGILNSLFSVRTNQLFNRMNKTQNAFYLSGLLIGSELQDVIKNQDCPLFLCSAKKLYDLYRMALKELGLADRTTFVAADLVEQAAMTGQKIIYEQYVNNKLLNE